MRRPRSKLQVSMFPFLAVLLCAMGALLLILFVMDRRAKIAAQHKVSEIKSERLARSKAEEDARKAEWEKAKSALHQTLLAQQDQLKSEANHLDSKLNDANKKLDDAQTKQGELQKKIVSELERIALLQVKLADQANGAKAFTQKENVSKAQLLEAAKELADLEQAFKKLRALKDDERKTYSVVPYRGKHGDMRPPIYVECVGDGVLFHPEKKLLAGVDFTPSSLRREVERRAGPLTLELTIKKKHGESGEDKSNPYVLFLVRPDGIATYYKAQASLKGFQLDFGYELVDQHWALDFGVPAGALPPIQIAKTNEPLKGPSIIAPPPLTLPPAPGFGGSGPPPLLPPPISVPAVSGAKDIGTPLVGVAPPTGNSPYQGFGAPAPLQSPSFVPIAKIAPPVPIATTGSASPGVNPPIIANTLPRTNGNAPSDAPSNEALPRSAAPNIGANDEPQADFPVRPVPKVVAEPVKKAVTAPPIGRVLGNKDFLITIECRGDHVSVFPGGMTFRWTPANMKATDQALVQGIKNLIAKRQASVRAGEPSYRPVIRFQVSAEGLRTYYQAYPLLESLGVPMRRENVTE
jgi:hypothetical protein